MARARFGPPIKENSWKFNAVEIVRLQLVLGTRTAGCDEDGVVLVDDDGRVRDTLSRAAVMYIVRRVKDAPDVMFRDIQVQADRSEKIVVGTKTNTYLCQVIPSRHIQPPMLIGDYLGRFYLVTEPAMVRDEKARQLEEMCLFNFKTQTVDLSRMKEYKDRVVQQEQAEKAAATQNTGDR